MGAPKGNQYAIGNSGGGRVSKYDPKCIPLVSKMCELGATDLDIADALGVSERTINNWRNNHEDFGSALKSSKAQADERVVRSLYRKACGYEFDSVKIFLNKDGEIVEAPYREIVPPSDTACIFWLKNRQKDEWRDKSEVEVPGLAGLAEELAAARKRV